MPVVADGKTKTFLKTEDGKSAMIQKPTVTIGDGAKKFIVPKKDVWVNQISYRIFRFLQAEHGVQTHLIGILSENSMLVEPADMIKVEVVIRGESAGSFAKRYPRTKGQKFKNPIVEFFYKGAVKIEKDGKIEEIEDPLMMWEEDEQCFYLYRPKERPSEKSCLGKLPADTPSIPKNQKEIMAMKNLARSTYIPLRDRFKKEKVDMIDMKIEEGWIIIN